MFRTFAALSLLSLPTFAQCNTWTGQTGPGVTGAVQCLAWTHDPEAGRPSLFVGGNALGGSSSGLGLVARDVDGSLVPLTSSLSTGQVRALAGLVAGGQSRFYLGGSGLWVTSPVSLVCWDGVGFVTFPSLPNGAVNALVEFDDGSGWGPSLYVAGEFTDASGAQESHVARWSQGQWSSLGAGVDGTVRALAVFDDGSGPALYAAGDFLHAGGNSAERIARWNGASWSAPGAGLNGPVYALAGYDSGSGPRLAACGSFTSSGAQSCMRVASWDGSIWSPLGAGLPGTGLALCSISNASPVAGLYAGGAFFGGPLRWDGTSWTALAGVDGGSLDGNVTALSSVSTSTGEERLVVGGSFTHVDHQLCRGVAVWGARKWGTFGLPVESWSPSALGVWDDGTGSKPCVAVLTGSGANVVLLDEGNWFRVGPALPASDVTKLMQLPAGVPGGPGLLAVGIFGSAPLSPIAKVWNGSGWNALGATGPFYFEATSAAVHDAGAGPRLYVGGGNSLGNLAWWDGTAWQTVSGSLDQPTSMLSWDDGSGLALYVAGPNGISGTRQVRRLQSGQWSSMLFLDGWNATTGPMRVYDDGSGPHLYLAGYFPLGAAPDCNVLEWVGGQFVPAGSGQLPAGAGGLELVDEGNGPRLAVTTADGLLRILDNGVWHTAANAYATGFGRSTSWQDGTDGPNICVIGSFGSVSGLNASDFAQYRSCPPFGPASDFCLGDGTQPTPCPCANSGAARNGCANSQIAEGARFDAVGSTAQDTLTFQVNGLVGTTVIVQGTGTTAGHVLGDGVLCLTGGLKRLAVLAPIGHAVLYPSLYQQSIRARAAVLGDPLPSGSMRYYQAYYRDNNGNFCSWPVGDNFNVSNGVSVAW